MKKKVIMLGVVFAVSFFYPVSFVFGGEAAETGKLPAYLSDRGEGIHTSLFGTYVREKELVFYPFYEYTRTSDFEYTPSDLRFAGVNEYFGKLVEQEFLVFFGYGFTDSLLVELESALYARSDFQKAPDDTTSAVPDRIEESGLGDTETQVRWRWRKETEKRPEVLFFFETVFPLQRNKRLIGTRHWEFTPGVNLTKGLPVGTLSLKLSLAYSTEENKLEFGEYAVEYVKRLNPAWRVVFSLEGESDEVQAIGEAQYTLARNAVLKINSGFGLTKKAPDIAPEIGVAFSF